MSKRLLIFFGAMLAGALNTYALFNDFSHAHLSSFNGLDIRTLQFYPGGRVGIEKAFNYTKRTNDKKMANVKIHEYQIAGIFSLGGFVQPGNIYALAHYDLAMRYVSPKGLMLEMFLGGGYHRRFYGTAPEGQEQPENLVEMVKHNANIVPTIGLGFGWDFSYGGRSRWSFDIRPSLLAANNRFMATVELGLRYKLLKGNSKI